MNDEGYKDPTAEQAVANVMREQRNDRAEAAMKTIRTLQSVAHLAGFDVIGRIELRDNFTGRMWK